MTKQKSIYITEEQEEFIMQNAHGMSFTKRIVELAMFGASIEQLVGAESQQRATELLNKGYLYEQDKEPKVNLKLALGYFNNMYRKKYPNEPLPWQILESILMSYAE